MDSFILAEYGRLLGDKLRLYSPSDESRLLLKSYYSRIIDLKALKQQESNRLKQPNLADKLRGSIRRSIIFLEQELIGLKGLIDSIIDKDKGLKQKWDLLLKEKGVGHELIHLLISELHQSFGMLSFISLTMLNKWEEASKLCANIRVCCPLYMVL